METLLIGGIGLIIIGALLFWAFKSTKKKQPKPEAPQSFMESSADMPVAQQQEIEVDGDIMATLKAVPEQGKDIAELKEQNKSLKEQVNHLSLIVDQIGQKLTEVDMVEEEVLPGIAIASRKNGNGHKEPAIEKPERTPDEIQADKDRMAKVRAARGQVAQS